MLVIATAARKVQKAWGVREAAENEKKLETYQALFCSWGSEGRWRTRWLPTMQRSCIPVIGNSGCLKNVQHERETRRKSFTRKPVKPHSTFLLKKWQGVSRVHRYFFLSLFQHSHCEFLVGARLLVSTRHPFPYVYTRTLFVVFVEYSYACTQQPLVNYLRSFQQNVIMLWLYRTILLEVVLQ